MAELYVDQAAGLRRLFARDSLRVVAFASGSPGVGKSVLVANLASCLAQAGKSVLVLDESTHRTVADCFGVVPHGDLWQAINRERSIADVLLHVFPGVQVLPDAQAVRTLGKLDGRQQKNLSDCFSALDGPVDVILVDASGDYPLGFSPLGLVAGETVIVMSPTSTSITDAYALIKKVSLGYARRNYRVLVNGVRSPGEARAIFANIARVTHSRRFARLGFAGSVPLDMHLRQAANLCQPVISLFPQAAAAKAFHHLACDLLGWPLPDQEPGGLEQFVEQLMQTGRHIDPVAIYA